MTYVSLAFQVCCVFLFTISSCVYWQSYIITTNPDGFGTKQSEMINVSNVVVYNEITDSEINEIFLGATGKDAAEIVNKLIRKRVNTNISLPITYKITPKEWNKITLSETEAEFIEEINKTIFSKLKLIQNDYAKDV